MSTDPAAGAPFHAGFHDPVRPDAPMTIDLEFVGPVNFTMAHQIAYGDEASKADFIVPNDVASFDTDLTSIPWVFRWLVPQIGLHLPAAILHDGLVYTPEQGKTYIGPDVSRAEADRILRDGMRDLGTPLIRRWLVWSGVSIPTKWSTKGIPSKLAVALTLGVVSVLGVMATLVAFHAWRIGWLGRQDAIVRFAVLGAAALVIPLLLSVLWGKLWKAGAIIGIALAFLLHVTLAAAIVYAIYVVLEKLVSGLDDGRGPSVKKNQDLPAVQQTSGNPAA